MKKNYSILIIAVLALGVGIFIWQYSSGGNLFKVEQAASTLPAHCSDKIMGNGETGLDCGWICNRDCSYESPEEVLEKDTTWSGNILVNSRVQIPEGVTLTIKPGTVVRFKYNRDYKSSEQAGIEVNGGTIEAIGTADEVIWFTSSSSNPVNGDWTGISLSNSDSVFDHVIVEFGEMGIEQFDSATEVTNSIIRWSNAEGLYAERSNPIFTNNTLYDNGYHEIALEQYNNNVQISNNYFKEGHFGIHHEKTTSTIENNYFSGYTNEVISAGMESDVIIKNNTFEDIKEKEAFNIYGNSKSEISDNQFIETGTPPSYDYQDLKNFAISYIPGDDKDQFIYVYDAEDKTRKVVKRIGKGLSFGWSLLYADDSLWRFSLGSGEVGEELDFIKINPSTGEYQKYGNNEIINPRGLTWDGKYFWVNDFSLLKLFKFTINSNNIKILNSYDIPEKELGGCSGLTSDGENLYLISREGTRLYQIDKSGKQTGEIVFADNQSVGGTIVWTEEYFWTNDGCQKGLCKWTKEGELAGEIYPPARDTWALAWDGEYLWTIQRTNELQDDAKIFKLEVIDDSLPESRQ